MTRPYSTDEASNNTGRQAGGGERGGKGRRKGKGQRMPRTQSRNPHVPDGLRPRTGTGWAAQAPNASDLRQEPGAGCDRKAGMSLPVQVWSVQSRAGRTGASLAGVAVTRGPKRRQRGCEIDSRNRHVAEAELAPAPAKAAQPLSLCERAAAPPGAEDTSRPKGADRNL